MKSKSHNNKSINYRNVFCGKSILSFVFLFLSSFLNAQPDANFSSDKTVECTPAIIKFTDLSTGNPTSWFWDFGNGNTSVLQNPTSFYTKPGAYTVKLVVSNVSGSDTLVKPYYIRAYASPESRFYTEDTAGCAPLKVDFIDASVPQSSVITTWFWNFGDGSYSMSQNPTHTYDSAGNYTVYLIVKDANGCQDFFFIGKYIKVHKPKAHFNKSIVGCSPPANVVFTDSSNGDKLSYRWDFGDGTTSIAVNPTHIYNTADT
ncbi:MAG: PKD domain-containing protein, partial [Bacteroidales bacterium]|nr:PKD domain-containing protein [Bacteroidales bacterium]